MATRREVAARAGVSSATVSRTFSRPQSVIEPTRERVLAAAAELGYSPHLVARSLASGRTGNIGLMLPDLYNTIYPPLADAVQVDAREAGYALFVAAGNGNGADELALVHAMAKQVDGLILVGPRMSDADLRALVDTVPVVLVNRTFPGSPAVLMPARDGIDAAIEHLVHIGHRALAYVAGPPSLLSARQRRAAVHQACAARGVATVELGPYEPRFTVGLSVVDDFLALNVPAALAYNDHLALGLMRGLAERGVRVGVDVDLVGIDDCWLAPVANPALTTIRLPHASAGEQALRLLLDILAGGFPASRVTLPTEFVVRATTRQAPIRAAAG